MIHGWLAVLPALWETTKALPAADSSQGFVGLPVRRAVSEHKEALPLVRRGAANKNNMLLNLDNKGTYYSVDIELGTPAQSVEVLLDTGSSDLWVDANTSHKNHFDFSRSTSFHKNDSQFAIGYGDNSKVSGFWGTDKAAIFGHTFDASFGVATESTATSPILGLGLTQGEVSVSSMDRDGNLAPTYPNFPALLKDNGYIYRTSYSLWLKDAANANGTILFGGVDHSKYAGDSLSLLPIVNDHSITGAAHPTTLSVLLHNVNLSSSDSTFSSTLNIPVLLDTGSTLCQLPSTFVDSLGKALNGDFNDDLGVYIVDCNSKGVVNFNLSGAIIPVDVSDLLIPLKLLGDTDKKSGSQCGLGIYKSDSRKSILGDGFLKNAYVAFDLEDLQVGIAPASNETHHSSSHKTSSSVEAIRTGIPNATTAPQYSYTAFSTA